MIGASLRPTGRDPAPTLLGPTLLQATAHPRRVDELRPPPLDVVTQGPLISATHTWARFSMPGVADFDIDVTTGVVVRAGSPSTPGDVGCFLTGTVRALHLALHGVGTLRGTAVLTHEGAVVICGPSGAGKSVVAAALALRGGAIIADGVCPVRRSHGQVEVWPTSTQVQLWPGAAERLGLDPAAGGTIRPTLSKRAFAVGLDHAAPHGVPAAVPVARVVVLDVDLSGTEVTVRAVDSGTARVGLFAGAWWHGALAQALDPSGHFSRLLDLAGGVPCHLVTRPRHGWTAESVAEHVEGLMS